MRRSNVIMCDSACSPGQLTDGHKGKNPVDGEVASEARWNAGNLEHRAMNGLILITMTGADSFASA